MRPEKIGKYEKLEQIGHGSSATVWLAQDTVLHRQIALKVIETEVTEPDRLFEESRIVVKLGEHPHIARVFDADMMNGLPVVVMEYVKGTTLEKRLNAESKFSIDESLRILAQILLALETAHNNRVLHGDIKPANILLDSNRQVKVTDFGLSQTLASHGYMQGAGTYAYMAPEDFSDEPATDIRKDIWSAGVILYRMLTGTRPYAAAVPNNPFVWQKALETQTPRPLADFLPNTPAFLQGIVSRALHKDKYKRFQSATTFLDALKTYGLYKLRLSSEHRNRFEDAFNGIVNHLRTDLNITDRNVGVPTLIDEYKKKYSDWQDGDVLREFVTLRNALAHNLIETGQYQPVPSLADIERLEAIAEVCTSSLINEDLIKRLGPPEHMTDKRLYSVSPFQGHSNSPLFQEGFSYNHCGVCFLQASFNGYNNHSKPIGHVSNIFVETCLPSEQKQALARFVYYVQRPSSIWPNCIIFGIKMVHLAYQHPDLHIFDDSRYSSPNELTDYSMRIELRLHFRISESDSEDTVISVWLPYLSGEFTLHDCRVVVPVNVFDSEFLYNDEVQISASLRLYTSNGSFVWKLLSELQTLEEHSIVLQCPE